MSYPSSLDNLTTSISPTEVLGLLGSGIGLAPILVNLSNGINTLEAKVGIDGSAVTTTIDYLLKSSSSSDPGHKHSTSSITGLPTFPSGTIVGTTDTQSLTNKTLTTPKLASFYQDSIGGSNLITVPAATDTLTGKATTDTLTNKTMDYNANTFQNFPSGSVDGWTSESHTWTYASASTFTVAGVDLTATFTPGTRLKFTQTTVKYAVVVSSTFSTNTTITIAVNTDYVIANASITSPYYSYQANPQGYPTWFNFTPVFTTSGTAFSNTPTVNLAKFSLLGRKAFIQMKWTQNATAGGTGDMLISIPLTPATAFDVGWGSSISANKAFAVAVANTPRFVVDLYDGTTAIANSAQQGAGSVFDIA